MDTTIEKQEFILPERKGDKPNTTSGLPHAQLTDNSSQEMLEELSDWVFTTYKDVHKRGSLFNLDFIGFIIDEKTELNPEWEKLQNPRDHWGREWGHIHTAPLRGSLHLWLPPTEANKIISKGWGEYHYLVGIGFYKPALVMIFAPRNKEDLEVIKIIINRSYSFITKTK